MNRKLLINHKILAMLDIEDNIEIDTFDDCIYNKEQRHRLHIIVGKLGNELLKYVTKYRVDIKDIQQYISEQDCKPLVRLGILEYATSPTQTFDIALKVDDYGNLLRVDIKSNGRQVSDTSVTNRTLELQDFIYRCIGKYYETVKR